MRHAGTNQSSRSTLSVERIVVWDGRLVGVEMPQHPDSLIGRGLIIVAKFPGSTRAGHGVRPVRIERNRCRRPAEPAGATGAAEWRWHCAMTMSRDQRRALRLLAGSPLGCTEAIMLAHVRAIRPDGVSGSFRAEKDTRSEALRLAKTLS